MPYLLCLFAIHTKFNALCSSFVLNIFIVRLVFFLCARKHFKLISNKISCVQLYTAVVTLYGVGIVVVIAAYCFVRFM